VRYVVVDAWAARAGRTRDADEVREVVAAARSVAGVEVEWAVGTAAAWPAVAGAVLRGGAGRGGWVGVVLGDVLDMVGLARGAALMAKVAEGVRAGGWAGAVVLATSARTSGNPDLMALEIPPRRSVAPWSCGWSGHVTGLTTLLVWSRYWPGLQSRAALPL
jgi:hypothetical protein